MADKSCVFNSSIICNQQDICKKCGWNPEVEAKRKAKMDGKVRKNG